MLNSRLEHELKYSDCELRVSSLQMYFHVHSTRQHDNTTTRQHNKYDKNTLGR